MFTIREGQTFWQSFSDQVDHFKELTKDMSEEKMFSLTQDPATTIKKTGIIKYSLIYFLFRFRLI